MSIHPLPHAGQDPTEQAMEAAAELRIRELCRQADEMLHDITGDYARARLADQRGVGAHEVEWPIGSVHDLRRSFATHMAPHVSMVELQHLMGHANIGTTAAFYVNVSDDLGDKLKVAFG